MHTATTRPAQLPQQYRTATALHCSTALQHRVAAHSGDTVGGHTHQRRYCRRAYRTRDYVQHKGCTTLQQHLAATALHCNSTALQQHTAS